MATEYHNQMKKSRRVFEIHKFKKEKGDLVRIKDLLPIIFGLTDIVVNRQIHEKKISG